MRSLRQKKAGSRNDPRSGNCLLVLLLIVAIAVIAFLVMEITARDKADEERLRQPPPPQKTAEEQERDRVEQLIFLDNPEVARDPKIDLSDKSVAVMQNQLALARRRLDAARRSRTVAETKLKRDKDNMYDLEARLNRLDAELDASPYDDELLEESGKMEARLDEVRANVVQAQADLYGLRNYEKGMARFVQDIESAIEKARRSSDAVVSTADMDALRTHYIAAMSAGTVVEEQRRNAQPAADGHIAEEEGYASADRERARQRRERRRAVQSKKEVP